ncbi:hypothetical protein M409DRAFT_66634 [Zasmidium cellare ATCC 36951]|uniref:Zn(2)-C6 fungal-type domain-containing protein n=1 Tax=Zasmidium cellare ATCC 36951 TaxID=1080233 RepID=A0A6A6CKC8_ZASCE|nr:uncharacterized protein M409DRAFT_66634 [Zasmidium cellare ATCC 36951]KAF2166658.1 hypothetical protein M409DRAFT_66634 [Zasmidium cellare ATCC 36951]
MPIKSTGCAQCRKRKIRCDETRPGCQRCKTHGVACPGYRLPAPGQLAFQDQTEWTVRNALRVYRKKQPVVVTVSAADGSSSSDGASSPGSESGSLGLVSTKSNSSSPDVFHKVRNETMMDFANAMYLYASPQYLPSPVMEKQLIYNTFIDVYVPKRVGEHDAHFSFLQHLITTSDLRPEVMHSLDAMSMVQVGSLYKDKDLLRQAVTHYHKALSGLLKTLSGMSAEAVNDDCVLATVNLLANCEFFDEIAQVGDGWTKHIQGSQQLLAARGPKSMTSRMSLLIFSNMRHGALSHSLLMRKACFLGTPEWRSVAWRAPYIDASTFLYDIALQVPALLERYDELDHKAGDALEQVDDILREAKMLETEMRDWFRNYQVRSKWADQKLYELSDIQNFPTFAGLIKDRTLKEAFTFPNFMVSYLLSVYWDAMHFLRTMIQSLHKARHKVQQDWYPNSDEAVAEEELMEYVMNLCRCFPFFVEPVSSSTGQIGLFLPLRTAAVYFTQQGHWSMLRWCGAVRDHAFTRGMRPPNVRARDPTMIPKELPVK